MYNIQHGNNKTPKPSRATALEHQRARALNNLLKQSPGSQRGLLERARGSGLHSGLAGRARSAGWEHHSAGSQRGLAGWARSAGSQRGLSAQAPRADSRRARRTGSQRGLAQQARSAGSQCGRLLRPPCSGQFRGKVLFFRHLAGRPGPQEAVRSQAGHSALCVCSVDVKVLF